MKRLCFGTLMNILYQARNRGVTNDALCGAIFEVYKQKIPKDSSFSGHLKSGHDNVPTYLVDAARTTNAEDAEAGFQQNVVMLIKNSKHVAVVRAVKDVLREDPIPETRLVGYSSGYEKENILNSSTFRLPSLLASVFYYAIVEVPNQSCKDAIKEIPKDYVEVFETTGDLIYFDNAIAPVQTPLKATFHDPNFNRVFEKISTITVSGLSQPSSAQIYGLDVNNCKFKFRTLKEFLVDNMAGYVLSRKKINRYNKAQKASAAGANAIIKFFQMCNISDGTALGEMLLYIFLEKELGAPKIMSKIEINDFGNRLSSKSDGVHLLTMPGAGQSFHQIVFGASDIDNDLADAVDRVFDKILEIESNSDLELRMVDTTTYYDIFDPDTVSYMDKLLMPTEASVPKPDMAFGAFLGYSLDLGYIETDNNKYRIAVKNKMSKDISTIAPYIEQKVVANNMSGYNFYFYVVPFNDASNDKSSIISEMLRGEF